MAPQKRKDKPMVLLKSLVLVILCLSFFVLSCNNSGSGSTTSSGGGGGTGTGWTITIQIGTNPLPLTRGSSSVPATTTIMALVKDKTGSPAPNGTNVCMTAVLNGFIKPGSSDVFATLCETTLNDIGQSIQTYEAAYSAGVDTIEVSSQGVIAKATLLVVE